MQAVFTVVPLNGGIMSEAHICFFLFFSHFLQFFLVVKVFFSIKKLFQTAGEKTLKTTHLIV